MTRLMAKQMGTGGCPAAAAPRQSASDARPPWPRPGRRPQPGAAPPTTRRSSTSPRPRESTRRSSNPKMKNYETATAAARRPCARRRRDQTRPRKSHPHVRGLIRLDPRKTGRSSSSSGQTAVSTGVGSAPAPCHAPIRPSTYDRKRPAAGPWFAVDLCPELRNTSPRGTELGFRNLTNYHPRSLPDTGGFKPRIHPLLR